MAKYGSNYFTIDRHIDVELSYRYTAFNCICRLANMSSSSSFSERAPLTPPFFLRQPPRSHRRGTISNDRKTNLEGEASHHLTEENTPPQSRYMRMFLELDTVPWLQNILASLSTWLLLAGYTVFPGTFTSIRNSQALENAGRTGKIIVKTFQNLPLLVVAALFCATGASGMSWFGWKWQDNYMLLLNKIIL
jgi:hypothetical protein